MLSFVSTRHNNFCRPVHDYIYLFIYLLSILSMTGSHRRNFRTTKWNSCQKPYKWVIVSI